MRNTLQKLCSCACIGLMGLLATVSATAQALEERVVEYTLDNGMQFLLVRRPTAPVFTGYIRFLVGGVDEHEGITGLAHLFEHMAFKGTPVIGTRDFDAEQAVIAEAERIGLELSHAMMRNNPADSSRIAELQAQLADVHQRQKEYIITDEFSNIYDQEGGVGTNASTSNDLTSYYVSLPANRLELWMLMESERMRWPVLREFYLERDVVAEERRLRTENSPFGKLIEQFFATAYTAHPYQNPTIGWMSDITALTHEEAETFYHEHYSPANAVGSIVGDIDIEKTKALLTQYFGAIPERGKPAPVKTREPEQTGERRIVVSYPAEPMQLIGWHKPTLPHYDDFVFDVIQAVLSNGRTSRLYTSLIKEQQVAVNAGSWQGQPGARYDNMFVLIGVPRHPNTVEDVEAAFMAELDRLKTEPVSERELQKIRNQIDASAVRGLASNSGLASQLTYMQQLAGDWRYILQQREIFKRVTPEDVMRVAQTYFVDNNKTVAVLQDSRQQNTP
jgi:predicted Zn-dependent peptidase